MQLLEFSRGIRFCEGRNFKVVRRCNGGASECTKKTSQRLISIVQSPKPYVSSVSSIHRYLWSTSVFFPLMEGFNGSLSGTCWKWGFSALTSAVKPERDLPLFKNYSNHEAFSPPLGTLVFKGGSTYPALPPFKITLCNFPLSKSTPKFTREPFL